LKTSVFAKELRCYQTDAEKLFWSKVRNRGFEGLKFRIMGVANNRSIAWGIAKALADQGAEIAFSYQGEALKKRVEPLAAEIGVTTLVECDVGSDAAMDETFRVLKDKWGTMDFLVHAIGFSDKERARRPLHRHQRRQFRADHEHLGLFVHRRRQARRSDAEPRRLAAHAHLLRRRESTCRTTTSWVSPRPRSRPACATSPPTWAPRTSASTPSPPAPDRAMVRTAKR
jgi:NAD(P)-dependent dehydrogenase (short-subunit alcohol dehydrogenase family)